MRYYKLHQQGWLLLAVCGAWLTGGMLLSLASGLCVVRFGDATTVLYDALDWIAFVLTAYVGVQQSLLVLQTG